MKHRFWSLAAALVLVMLLLSSSSASVQAATTISDDKATVSADETIEGNLYIAGDSVTIEGTVTGDVIAVGRQITLGEDGEIGGDLLCAAANIYIEGNLKGDLRCAGYTIEMMDASRVGGEVTTAGFGLHLSEGGVIDGEILALGAQAVLSGDVNSDVRFAGAGLEINGRVNGDVVAKVAGSDEGSLKEQTAFTTMMPNAPQAPPAFAKMGLTIGPDAEITGDLSYESPEEAEIPRNGVAGTVTFDEIVVQEDGASEDREPDSPFVKWLKAFRQSFVPLLVFGTILLFATPRLLNRGRETVATQALPSAGWGLLTVVVAFAGVFVLLLGTLIGLILFGQIGLPALSAPLLATSALVFVMLTMGTLLLSWVGRAIVGYFLGRWILDRSGEGAMHPFIALLLGTLIYALLVTIPYVGGLIGIVAMLIGLGAVVWHLFRLMSALRSDATTTSAGV
jgi:cytoskeletal protein CcmA (bactofilin family)